MLHAPDAGQRVLATPMSGNTTDRDAACRGLKVSGSQLFRVFLALMHRLSIHQRLMGDCALGVALLHELGVHIVALHCGDRTLSLIRLEVLICRADAVLLVLCRLRGSGQQC